MTGLKNLDENNDADLSKMRIVRYVTNIIVHNENHSYNNLKKYIYSNYCVKKRKYNIYYPSSLIIKRYKTKGTTRREILLTSKIGMYITT